MQETRGCRGGPRQGQNEHVQYAKSLFLAVALPDFRSDWRESRVFALAFQFEPNSSIIFTGMPFSSGSERV
jgi:hypothetical protein